MKLFQKPKFLSDSDMQQIHEASVYLLEHKGVVFRSPEAADLFAKKGARVDGEIVYLSRELVDACLKTVPASFRMEAINESRSVTIGGGDLIVHPAGGEVVLHECGGVRRAQTGIQDFIDLQKLYQACGNINMTGYQPLSPSDVPMETRNLRCLYETMLYTDKPWLAPMDVGGKEDKRREIDMYRIVFGDDFVQNHYVTWSIVTPESPLVYGKDSCESIMEFAASGQPVALVSAPMSGITSPVHILGTIVQANAETLAGLCLAQCVNPGIPVLPSASLTYGNLKIASWECASPDTALMLAGAIQMYKDYYRLPARAQTGVTSSKCLDYQAGFETMQSLLLTVLLDVDVTSQSAGSMENLLTVSLEKTLIDNEVIARVKRIAEGIEISEETLSVDVMMEIGHGENFLMHDSTLDHLYDGWQADISDWNLYDRWKEQPYPDIEQRASQRVKQIIGEGQVLLESKTAARLQKYLADCGLTL